MIIKGLTKTEIESLIVILDFYKAYGVKEYNRREIDRDFINVYSESMIRKLKSVLKGEELNEDVEQEQESK